MHFTDYFLDRWHPHGYKLNCCQALTSLIFPAYGCRRFDVISTCKMSKAKKLIHLGIGVIEIIPLIGLLASIIERMIVIAYKCLTCCCKPKSSKFYSNNDLFELESEASLEKKIQANKIEESAPIIMNSTPVPAVVKKAPVRSVSRKTKAQVPVVQNNIPAPTVSRNPSELFQKLTGGNLSHMTSFLSLDDCNNLAMTAYSSVQQIEPIYNGYVRAQNLQMSIGASSQATLKQAAEKAKMLIEFCNRFPEGKKRVKLLKRTNLEQIPLAEGLCKWLSTDPSIATVTELECDSVPPEIRYFKNLQKLQLGHCPSVIPIEIGELKELKELTIWSGPTLPLQIFELKGLCKLSIHSTLSNPLTTLPPEILQLENLEELDLSNNGFIDLPTVVLSLEKLKKLNLRFNRLQQLPAEINQLKQLQELEICLNNFQSLPSELGELEELTTLEISYNQFTSFPSSILSLRQLRDLDMSNNSINEIPRSISQLSRLMTLNIRSCNLSSLPDEIGSLSNLQALRMSNNSVREISPTLAQLGQLKSLDISNCLLSTLPDEIGSLSNLKFLYMSKNSIKRIPTTLAQINSLRKLYVDRGVRGLEVLDDNVEITYS